MNLEVDLERLLLAHKTVRAELLAEFTADSCWVGEISSSPVATAAAISALVLSHRQDTDDALREVQAGDRRVIEHLVQSDLSELLLESVHWLARRQNADGGWGDCEGARSNIAATMLVQAAFRLTGTPAKYADLMMRADQFVAARGGVSGLRRSVGRNKTYLASILLNCAAAGMVPWRQVPALPFEWLSVPSRWQHDLGLPVARCVAPMVMAVGLSKYRHDPPRNPATWLVRRVLQGKTLAALERLQAADDSFQASPLATAFVVMSLASMGRQEHANVERGIEFLLSAVRADASWAVTTGRETNNTALALASLTATCGGAELRSTNERERGCGVAWQWPETATAHNTMPEQLPRHMAAAINEVAQREQPVGGRGELGEPCIDWLLKQQRMGGSLLTHAPLGGWAAGEAAGADPNTISTASVLVALAWARSTGEMTHLGRTERAADLGVGWLLAMQNEDGGWPTFCRDDDTHPMDGSGIDATALALRALAAWQRVWQAEARREPHSSRGEVLEPMSAAIAHGIQYLEAQQADDGSFAPVWFGNEYQAKDENLVLGTAQVLTACAELHGLDSSMAQRAVGWLQASQHSSGGWGPPRVPVDYSDGERNRNFRSWRENDALAKFCSVEETAAAVTALLPVAAKEAAIQKSVSRGLAWLTTAVEQDRHRQPAIVGFYLGQIWFRERLYPLVFAAGALTQAVATMVAVAREPAVSS